MQDNCNEPYELGKLCLLIHYNKIYLIFGMYWIFIFYIIIINY